MPKLIKVPNGFRSGRLKVEKQLIVEGENWRQRRTVYECCCDCGKMVIVEKGSRLLNNHVKSCGCLQVEIQNRGNIKHGMSGTKEWEAWHSMLARCYDEKRKDYQSYGGRGITVCEQWRKSFVIFL